MNNNFNNIFRVVNDFSIDFSIYNFQYNPNNVDFHQVNCPAVIERWLESMKLEIYDSQLFITPPSINNSVNGAYLHVDTDRLNKDFPKFNWAIGGGDMIWMMPKKDNVRIKVHYTSYGNPYARVHKSSCIELCRTVIENKTTLIQAGIPHTIEYIGSVPRYCYSVTPKKKNGEIPSFMEVVELLKNT